MSMRFKKEDWILFGRWVQPTMSSSFWVHWYESESVRKLFPGIIFSPILFLDGHILFPANDAKKMRIIIETKFSEGSIQALTNSMEELFEDYKQQHLDLLDIKKSADTEVYVLELIRTYSEVVGLWTFCSTFSSELTSYILEHNLASSEDDILQKVTSHMRKTWLEQQILEIRELGSEIKNDNPSIKPESITLEFLNKHPGLLLLMNEHVEKYEWLGTHHWIGEPYNLDNAIEDLAQEMSKDSEGYTGVDDHVEVEEFSYAWKLTASFMYWRTHMAEVSVKVVYASRDVLTEFSKKLDLNYDDLMYLSAGEVLAMINTKNKVLPSNYLERKKGFGCYIDNAGREVVVTGDELSDFVSSVISFEDKNLTELTGSVASKGGKIEGIVKVVLSPKDFDKFEEGDILVASETTPNFVPLMKKAKAIVTETGGITSHAAIISRELRKPCIIGTKIATQVLKDGDLVEVDAESGVVKVIKTGSE